MNEPARQRPDPAQQPDRPLSPAERQALREMTGRLARTHPDLADRLDEPSAVGATTALLLGAVVAMVLFTAVQSLTSALVVLVVLGPSGWLLGRHFDRLLRQRRPR